MNVEFRTRRATGAACWEALKFEWKKTRLGRRSSGNARSPDEIETRRQLFRESDPRDRGSQLNRYLRRCLRNRCVADVADLAMIFVVRVGVPVADGVRRQKSEREDNRDRQQTIDGSLCHSQVH
jgi:hypothetical protein